MNQQRSYASAFADIYDEFMQDAPYDLWFHWVSQSAPDLSNFSVVDLGCGTGRLTMQLARVCQRVIGVDMSNEMLSQAANMASNEQLRIQWLCQDIRNLRLPHRIDIAISASDSLNYMLSESDLKQVLENVCSSLKPGGWLFFDLIGTARLRQLQDGFSYDLRDDAAVLFESEVSPEGRISYDVHAFVSESGSHYQRFVEHHVQQYFAPEVVVALLRRVGFAKVELQGDFGQCTPSEAYRYTIAARKPS